MESARHLPFAPRAPPVAGQLSQYYPGAGIAFRGADTAHHTTSTILELKVVAKSSTADLPDGVNPCAVVVGVRFQGGMVVSQRFDFDALVP